ncbi:hypothetical protein RND81_10G058700 [Saponaria officinalis]|uniref:Uncharacterized protein n=1 Tax=Saponaria officinalis TaxID=3572 RepID=A0AAW1HYN0_SAPOF
MATLTMKRTMMKIFPNITLLLSLIFSITSLVFFTSYGFLSADYTNALNLNDANLPPSSNSNSDFTCDFEELKLRLSKLEVSLEMTEHELNTKSVHILQCEEKIEELSQTIHQLEANLSNVEEAPDYEQVIDIFEKQVRELEAGVRRNDRELQLLKHRAKDSDNRVDSLSAQVKTMAVIVSEFWFHVQKLEQAQEVIERRTAELRRYIRNQKCFFFKFISNFGGRRYQEVVAPYTSKALNLLEKSLSAVKKYHHQLQGSVKRAIDKHELTVLAGEESIFSLASIIFILPIMFAWTCLSSRQRELSNFIQINIEDQIQFWH